ncbi:MAG: hypothetical protein ACOCRO_10825 [Halanaerobiales bacterium]
MGYFDYALEDANYIQDLIRDVNQTKESMINKFNELGYEVGFHRGGDSTKCLVHKINTDSFAMGEVVELDQKDFDVMELAEYLSLVKAYDELEIERKLQRHREG